MPSLPSLPRRSGASRVSGPPAPRLPPVNRSALVRHWMTRTFSGRAVLGGVVAKAVAFILGLITGPTTVVQVIDTCGDLAIIIGALIVFVLLSADMKQRLLWRIRRKLAVSYIFMGLIPALLIIVFFLVAGLLLFLNISAYMMRAEIAGLVDQTRLAADSAALGVARETGPEGVREALQLRQSVMAARYPGASVALVPSSASCRQNGSAPPASRQQMSIGPWSHMTAPVTLPSWVPCTGFKGLIAFNAGGTTRIASRAVAWPPGGGRAVVLDVPVDAAFERDLLNHAGVTLGGITEADEEELDELLSGDADVRRGAPGTLPIGQATTIDLSKLGTDRRINWATLLDSTRWDSGEGAKLLIGFGMSPADVYERLALTPESRIGNRDVGRALLILLALIAVMFLIIQVVAFAMGLALARSITGSVHELAEGTERVRRGDFTRRVSIMSRDQLGDLAESFNSMTASIEDLLQAKAEKERMEQELRIARQIQMSLLPQGPLAMPGVSLTAHCEPAREVGGDYYDFLPIDEHTLGILIADVSGKGTSAALYMAELKGIVLSLSQRHRSPRDLLIEADRIISRHLDSRSFITVTYLVVDLRAGTIHYARAGHCPMVYVPGPYAARRSPQLMTPDGMVLGLQLDEGRTFGRLLEEVTIPLGRGDLFVLYTDGLTEAMNHAGDCFGDTRLADLIAQHADLPADELRERILREIDAFTDSALQQDDMTMVLLRVEQVGQPTGTTALAHADA